MPKFRNVYHDTLITFVGANRVYVKPGDVLDVPADEADGFTVQVGEPGSYWEAATPVKTSKHEHADEPSDS